LTNQHIAERTQQVAVLATVTLDALIEVPHRPDDADLFRIATDVQFVAFADGREAILLEGVQFTCGEFANVGPPSLVSLA
jgi:hypothetical protein